MALVLQGGAVLTVNAANEFLPAADIRIDGPTIAAIGAAGSLDRPGDEVIDATDTLVTPGLVNVHTHAATAFFRGLADDKPRDFWAGYAVPGQEHFTIDDYKASVRAACAEFLLNGVTTIADRLGDMDQIAPVIDETGIRAIVGQTITDRNAADAWRITDALIERFGSDPKARLSAGIAPHALDTCSRAGRSGRARACLSMWRKASLRSQRCGRAATRAPPPACSLPGSPTSAPWRPTRSTSRTRSSTTGRATASRSPIARPAISRSRHARSPSPS
jgi:cytosine/adenosine deaminase-related metal-dependent hydrolase